VRRAEVLTEPARAGYDLGPLVGALLFLIAVFALVLWLRRRRDRVVTRSVQTGAGVMLREGGTSRPPKQAGAGSRSAPSQQRFRLPSARLGKFARLGKPVRGLAFGPSRRRPTEPVLTSAVLIHGPWFHTVYHGCGGSGGARVVIRAATVRGVAHAFDGTPAQDACGITWNQERQSLIAAVADGLGSKPDSGDVAHHAVAGVLREGQRLATGKDFAAILEPAAGHVRRFVEKNQFSGATTLVLSEIRPTPDGAEVTVSAVGDSEAWFLHDGTWTVLHHERRSDGENVTRHLPSQARGRARRVRVPHGSVVVLASDGFASALGMDGSPLGRELAARWRQPPPPVEFLAQVGFEDEYFTDDRTAVAVWIR